MFVFMHVCMASSSLLLLLRLFPLVVVVVVVVVVLVVIVVVVVVVVVVSVVSVVSVVVVVVVVVVVAVAIVVGGVVPIWYYVVLACARLPLCIADDLCTPSVIHNGCGGRARVHAFRYA